MPDGNVANAYADIRADTSKLEGDLSRAKQLLLQRIKELENQAKVPLSVNEQLLKQGLEAALTEVEARIGSGVILPVQVNVDEAAALAEIENISGVHPVITAEVAVDDAGVIAAVAEIESVRPIVDVDLVIDPDALARVEDVEAEIAGTHPVIIVDADVSGAITGVQELNGVLIPLGSTAEEVAARLAGIGTNSGLELAALQAEGLSGLYHNVAVSVDEATGAIIVQKGAITSTVAATTASTASLVAQTQVALAAARAKIALRDADVAAAEGEAVLNSATLSGIPTVNTSQLGFTRLGGSLALVGGQLLGLPPLLNLTLAVLGRDVVKIATKQLDALAISIGEAKTAAAIDKTVGVVDLKTAEQTEKDLAHTQALEALAAAEAEVTAAEEARLEANAALAEASAALFDADEELLVVEGGITEEYLAQVAATEALLAARATLVAATEAEVEADAAAALAEQALAAARIEAAAAAEAEAVAAFSSTGILIGLAVAIGAAALAYKIFSDDGSQKRIQEATDKTTKSIEKEIETLEKAGGAAATFGSQFATASLGLEVLSKSIEAAVGTKELDKFNAALLNTGTSLSRLPELTREIFAPGKVDLSQLFPAAFAEVPEKYRKVVSDVLQEERNFTDAQRQINDDISRTDLSQPRFFSTLSDEAQASLDAVHEIFNQLNNIDITSAFTKSLNTIAVNGTLLEQELAKRLSDALAAGKIQVEDAINALNDLFKTEAFDSKVNDIRKQQLISQAAFDPAALKIYKAVLDGAKVSQTDLNEVTSKFGIDPVDAIAAGKIAYDAEKKSIDEAAKAVDKKAKEDEAARKKLAEDRKKQAEEDAKAYQKQRDQIDAINALIGTEDKSITGVIGQIGQLNQADLENLKTNLTNLNSATDQWATGITTKLFPTLDSLFDDKLTKKGRVSLKNLTADVQANLDQSTKLFNEQQFIDPTKFANTLKTFGDVVGNEGPKAAQKFFDAFRTATPEQRDAFEKAAQQSQDAFQFDTAKFKAEGQAIGAAIAPEIVNAINFALRSANLVDPITGALQSSIASAGKSPQDRDEAGAAAFKARQVTAANNAGLAAASAYEAAITADPVVIPLEPDTTHVDGALGDISEKPVDVTIDPDMTHVDGALGDISETPITVPLVGNTSDITDKLNNGFTSTVSVSATPSSLQRLAQQIRDATTQAGKFAGGPMTAGERSWTNEFGPEGWLPMGASLDKMTIIGGGKPWTDFVAPTSGTVIDHATTERILAMGARSGNTGGIVMHRLDAVVARLHAVTSNMAEIVNKPPQIHVHTNSERPESHGAVAFWSYKKRGG